MKCIMFPVGQRSAGKPSLKQIPHNMYVFCPSCMPSVSTIKSQLSAAVRKVKLHFDILKHAYNVHVYHDIYIIYIIYSFSMIYFGAFLSKRVRRFDPSSTGLDHVLVSRVLPQISAG